MNYIPRRILTYVGVLIVALNVDFILPRLAPGNAAQILAPSGGGVPEAEIHALEARFGLDQSVYVQYLDYLRNIFGNWPPYFGVSFQFYPTPVTILFEERIGWTILLIAVSFVLALAIAYAMAMFSSLRRGGKFEVGALYSSIAFQATPIYWTGMVLLWIFAVGLNWFPSFGSYDVNSVGTDSYILSVIWHSVLPVLTMTASIFGENYLILRGSVQEVLKSDYVVAAKTRGMRESVVATGYILRNSLLPLVSLLAFSLSSLIGRIVLVESVFGYPGVGDLIVDAIVNRDYPVMEGTFFLITVLVVVGGIVGDLALVKLDPRLRR